MISKLTLFDCYLLLISYSYFSKGEEGNGVQASSAARVKAEEGAPIRVKEEEGAEGRHLATFPCKR